MIRVVSMADGRAFLRISGKQTEFYGDLAKVKKLRDARYLPDQKLWSVPEDALDEMSNASTEISIPSLPDVVVDNREVEAGLFTGLDLEFQRKGASFLYARRRACLLDDFGLGKTAQAIRAILKIRLDGRLEKTLVVTKSTLKSQWAQKIEEFSPLKVTVICGDRRARAKAWKEALESDVVVINYELLLQDLDMQQASSIKWSCVIVDEAQMVRNRTAKRSKALFKLKSEYLFILTATPVQNRAEEIYSIMKLVDPNILGKWTDFAREHIEFDAWWKPATYRGLDKIAQKIAPWCLRRTVEDVGHEMPEVVRTLYEVEMTPLQRRLHDELSAELEEAKAMMDELGSSGQDEDTLEEVINLQNRILGLYTLLLEVCDSPKLLAMSESRSVRKRVEGVPESAMASPKLVELLEIIGEWIERGEKIVVFSQYPNMLHIIDKELRAREMLPAMLYGAMSVSCGRPDCGACPEATFRGCDTRQKNVWRFWNEPGCMVFLSTDAGGAGLNLQCASGMVNFDLPWNPSDADQRHGRIRRIGSPFKMVRVIDLVTEDGIDRSILDAHARKRDIIEAVLSGTTSL